MRILHFQIFSCYFLPHLFLLVKGKILGKVLFISFYKFFPNHKLNLYSLLYNWSCKTMSSTFSLYHDWLGTKFSRFICQWNLFAPFRNKVFFMQCPRLDKKCPSQKGKTKYVHIKWVFSFSFSYIFLEKKFLTHQSECVWCYWG